MGIFHRTDFEGVWNSALFVRNKTFFWYFFLRKPSIMYFYYPFLLDDLCVNHFITRWVAPRSSKKNMKPYQTLKTHSHSSNTPVHLPERCSFAPSKKIFRPHAHLAGTIFIFQMGLRSKDIIIDHHY